jgi:hypothetical protein
MIAGGGRGISFNRQSSLSYTPSTRPDVLAARSIGNAGFPERFFAVGNETQSVSWWDWEGIAAGFGPSQQVTGQGERLGLTLAGNCFLEEAMVSEFPEQGHSLGIIDGGGAATELSPGCVQDFCGLRIIVLLKDRITGA